MDTKSVIPMLFCGYGNRIPIVWLYCVLWGNSTHEIINRHFLGIFEQWQQSRSGLPWNPGWLIGNPCDSVLNDPYTKVFLVNSKALLMDNGSSSDYTWSCLFAVNRDEILPRYPVIYFWKAMKSGSRNVKQSGFHVIRVCCLGSFGFGGCATFSGPFGGV